MMFASGSSKINAFAPGEDLHSPQTIPLLKIFVQFIITLRGRTAFSEGTVTEFPFMDRDETAGKFLSENIDWIIPARKIGGEERIVRRFFPRPQLVHAGIEPLFVINIPAAEDVFPVGEREKIHGAVQAAGGVALPVQKSAAMV